MECEPSDEPTSRGKQVAAHLQANFLAISTAALDIGLKSYRHRVHGAP